MFWGVLALHGVIKLYLQMFSIGEEYIAINL